jgi:hypothetical protein
MIDHQKQTKGSKKLVFGHWNTEKEADKANKKRKYWKWN